MSVREKKGFVGRALDVSSQGPGRIAAGLALGALAGLAPWDSGLFVFAVFLIAFSEASGAVGIVAAAVLKASSVALEGPAIEVGRSVHEGASATQQFICSLPGVALLGLERHSVLGGLLLAIAAAPFLGGVGFVVQKKLLAAKEARARKERKKAKDDWAPLVRARWTDEVWDSLPPLRKWLVLGALVAAVPPLVSNCAGRWLLESELPSLVASELGSCGPVSVGAVDASIFACRIHARDVVITSERASLTIPEVEIELDGVSLLRRRVVAKFLRARGANIVLERGAWPLPPLAAPSTADRNPELASTPRWGIWRGEVEDLEVDIHGEEPRHFCVRSGELVDIGPRGQKTRTTPSEVHLRGEKLVFDMIDGSLGGRAVSASTAVERPGFDRTAGGALAH